eukprot:Blabericola_migrator_1__1818@NODE_1493_length_4426_cov_80_141776_g980_i0_p3_GENE_NODE_1493_length_4426_cov_80_141776_g980_i0NODE_1493_length_4426_cov_80_141776_g980_i0_p3_ORF_typecomplete_len101_score5_43_NODE_1493_length_4426_cov_80_141776_g980_i017052007
MEVYSRLLSPFLSFVATPASSFVTITMGEVGTADIPNRSFKTSIVKRLGKPLSVPTGQVSVSSIVKVLLDRRTPTLRKHDLRLKLVPHVVSSDRSLKTFR